MILQLNLLGSSGNFYQLLNQLDLFVLTANYNGIPAAGDDRASALRLDEACDQVLIMA
ncbi:hypothetical protein KQ313_00515 [Synechococcus sp. CS-1325]|uniref:hypothetical protein n=1 Tax=unclassified Synechococcus TaxID=2626047 RepID=UPI0021A61EC4|nr:MULTISPECIES: hypothetical protein [unclassified Synechococcus]MCT0198175.1 hypothetical protein [Synechococcus sp. CS-1325]MCT0233004.1 hypothetical protein [Synechococcus sp. CS-1327]